MASTIDIALTPEETRLFGKLFSDLDKDNTSVLLGTAIRPLLEQTGLPGAVLGQVWSMVDVENRGFLDFDGFAKAMRAIAHVQQGTPLSPRLLTIPSGLPSFQGAPQTAASPTATPASVPAIPRQRTSDAARARDVSNSSQATTIQRPGSTVDQTPSLSSSDNKRFAALFAKLSEGAQTLGKPAVMDTFLKARLSQQILDRIWELVDRRGAGALTRNQFVFGMHLIQSIISGQLQSAPSYLQPVWTAWMDSQHTEPPQILATPAAVVANSTGNSLASFRTPSGNLPPYTITRAQKEKYDTYFRRLDPQNTGFAGPGEIVPFFRRSKLPENVLAQIWDLADTEGRGQLNRQQFIYAMYFAQSCVLGTPLPETLPQQLVQCVNNLENAPAAQSIPEQAAVLSPQVPPVPAERSVPATGTAPATGSLTDLAGLDLLTGDAKSAQASAQPSQPPAPLARTDTMSSENFIPKSSFGQALVSKPNENAEALKTLTVENTKLQYQARELDAMHAVAKEELANVELQKTTLEAEIRSQRETYDAEATRVHRVQEQVKQVRSEIQQLQRSQTLRQSGLAALKMQYEEAKTDLNKLKAETAELELQLKTAREESDAKEAEIEGIHDQCHIHEAEILALQEETEHFNGQLNDYQSQIAALQQDISSAKSSTEAAREKRSQIEELVREAKDTVDMLTAESVKVQQELAAEKALLEGQQSLLEATSTQREELQLAKDQHIKNTVAETAAAATAAFAEASIPIDREQAPNSASHPVAAEYATDFMRQHLTQEFVLPMGVPASATSSVVNNPPQSVRDDTETSPGQSPSSAASEPTSPVPPIELVSRFEETHIEGVASTETTLETELVSPNVETKIQIPDQGQTQLEQSTTEPAAELAEPAAEPTETTLKVLDETVVQTAVEIPESGLPPADEVTIQQTSIVEATETPIANAATEAEIAPVASSPDPAATYVIVQSNQMDDEFGDAFNDLEDAAEDPIDAEPASFDASGDVDSPFHAAGVSGQPKQSALGPDEWQELFSGTLETGTAEDAVADTSADAVFGVVDPAKPAGSNEDAIAELTSMGFSREKVVSALAAANGDIGLATSQLLEGI